jgi:hypothetical protein
MKLLSYLCLHLGGRGWTGQSMTLNTESMKHHLISPMSLYSVVLRQRDKRYAILLGGPPLFSLCIKITAFWNVTPRVIGTNVSKELAASIFRTQESSFQKMEAANSSKYWYFPTRPQGGVSETVKVIQPWEPQVTYSPSFETGSLMYTCHSETANK